MSAYTRTRLPAALCVLLLLTFCSIAHAGAPGRPIDRSGGPPDQDPAMVGDPDDGQGHIVIIPTTWGVFVIQFRELGLWSHRALAKQPVTIALRPRQARTTRGGHAH